MRRVIFTGFYKSVGEVAVSRRWLSTSHTQNKKPHSMPVNTEISDNGNCLTYVATGIVKQSDFARSRQSIVAAPDTLKNITYVVIDYSDVQEVQRPQGSTERSINAQQRATSSADIIITVLSDRLMQSSHEKFWRDYARENDWKYAIFTDRDSLNEWVFEQLGYRYTGTLSNAVLAKNRAASKRRGLEKLGFILDPLASYLGVSTTLIMSYHDDVIEVLESNFLPDNSPFVAGQQIAIGDDSHCFATVINTGRELYIANAEQEPQWQQDPTLKQGFQSFIGLPIRRPDGDIFGLVCLFNESPILLDARKRSTLMGTRDVLETQLRLKFDNEQIHDHLREILALQVSLERESNTDYLTGFFNRKNFQQIAEGELNRSRRRDTALSFIFCDIDHFKAINDTYGHGTGDEVLKHFSRVIKANIRAYDSVWRWGGEEFLLQLPETDAAEAKDVANKLRSIIEQTDFYDGQQKIHLTASFGVAEIAAQEKIDHLLARLDKLLYQAKHQGRNLVITAARGLELAD